MSLLLTNGLILWSAKTVFLHATTSSLHSIIINKTGAQRAPGFSFHLKGQSIKGSVPRGVYILLNDELQNNFASLVGASHNALVRIGVVFQEVDTFG